MYLNSEGIAAKPSYFLPRHGLLAERPFAFRFRPLTHAARVNVQGRLATVQRDGALYVQVGVPSEAE